MGYHVEIDKDDRDFIRRLKTSPSEIFGRPYAGYLFFLVGSPDIAALEWLKTNVLALDSLTGDHVAYAIFARKVPFRVRVEVDGDERSPCEKGNVPLPEIHRLDAYLKAASKDLMADGDSLNAVTYATDDIARAFGVLDRLPCVLVLDAFPAGEMSIVQLDDSTLAVLWQTLRTLVHRLTQDTHFVAFVAAIEALASLTAAMERSISHIRSLEAQLELCAAIRESLRKGASKEFRRLTERLGQLAAENLPSVLPESTGVAIKGYARTIEALRDFSAGHWSPEVDAETRLAHLFEEHVLRLAPDFVLTPNDDHSNVLRAVEALTKRQDELIDKILGERLTSQAITDRIGHARAALATLQNNVRVALRSCLSEDSPSVRKLLSEIARERSLKVGIAKVTQKAQDYLKGALDPKTIGHLLASGISL